MAVIKAINSRASIAKAIKYITKDEKTEKKLISGIECSPQSAIEQMKTTKAVWDKTEGRQYAHFIQSFPPNEKITPEQAHEIAVELSEKQFKEYEVLIATHKDKKHIHSHIIVNTVNYNNGRKLHRSAHDLANMKEQSDELCRERGFSIAHENNEVVAYTNDKYKVLEKAFTGDYESYLVNMVNAVDSAKKKATSREDFILELKQQGIETKWKDTRKHITFQDRDGNKVRDTNLEKTFKGGFGKEQLENEFQRNAQRDRTKTVTQGDGSTPNVDWGAVERNVGSQANRLSELTGNEIVGTIQRQVRAVKERADRAVESTEKRIARDEEQRRQLAERKQPTQQQHKKRDRGIDIEL